MFTRATGTSRFRHLFGMLKLFYSLQIFYKCSTQRKPHPKTCEYRIETETETDTWSLLYKFSGFLVLLNVMPEATTMATNATRSDICCS